MPDMTPEELLDIYTKGFKGFIPNEAQKEALLSSLENPVFSMAAPHLYGSGKGKLSLPFKCVLQFDPDAYEEKQTTGDCVSHGTRNAVDVTRAVQILVNNRAEGWITRGATEAIYGCRGHGGQGMSGSEAAQFVHKDGGVALRQKYGKYDLSVYDADIGSAWGSRGVPSDLCEILRKNQVQTITLIDSLEEARDALANGYGLACCSNYGFSSQRDDRGFARRQGSWNHCMAWVACDDTQGETAFLIQNSWGAFNSGGKQHGQPDGSFWIHQGDAEGMISARETFAFSMVQGFPPQKLPDLGNEYL